MSKLYGEQHQVLQEMCSTQELAKRLQHSIVVNEFGDEHKAFIEERDMFFLTSVDHRGYPTCSYKGGKPGFVRLLDERNLAFPVFNGNGMYLSLGNIDEHPKVGLLFIDLVSPHRLRVHGVASVVRDDASLGSVPGAEVIVRVAVTEVFVNCARYVHR